MGNILGGPPPPFNFIQCQGTDCCNGIDGLCSFGPDEILWANSHNAMSSRAGGLPVLYNNLFKLEDALKTGYRAFGLDVCNCNGIYQLCHGICYIGARNPETIFGNIVDFLNDNPTEFVLITLQIDSNADDRVTLDGFYSVLERDASQFLDMIYVHSEDAPSWPTLGELKTLQKRILVFHYNGEENDCSGGKCPPGFHYWFDYAAETEFSYQDIDDLLDTERSCAITRGAGSTFDFVAVNAFTTPATQRDSETINTEKFLTERINNCTMHHQPNLDVNLVTVDFWSIGDLPALVQKRNKELVKNGGRKLETS